MNNKKIYLLIMFSLCLICCVYLTSIDFFKVEINNKNYNTGSNYNDLVTGTYTSSDGKHNIVIGSDDSILYDGSYSLTLNQNEKGNTITGKIGTDNKSVIFYQLNGTSIISGTTISYTHNDVVTYLYDYTGFKVNVTPVTDSDGIFEVWKNDSKVNTYSDFQSAIDASSDGDTIKITEDFDVKNGVFVDKKITIDGMGNSLDRRNWNNSVFVVGDNGDLKLKNIIIDGGATGFEVDFDAVTFKDYFIPLKTGSLDNDPKVSLSAILVRGNLFADNINIDNNYTASPGGAINIVSGNATIESSSFEHNFGNTYGGAINVGSIFGEVKNYPVNSVTLNDCSFYDNYVANSNNTSNFSLGYGGAMHVFNATKVDISESFFSGNVAHYGKGGALNFADESTSNILAEDLGLDYTQATITDTDFYNNWAGNDGFAIQSYAADLYVDGCFFKANVGVNPTGSVGTISIESYRDEQRIYSSFNDCLFEENRGPCSGIGDHSSLIDIDMTNCEFRGNIGNETILFYSAVSNIKNCKFVDEVASVAVIDARIYENRDILPLMTLTNVKFERTIGPADVLVRKQKHNMDLNDYKVVLKGNNTSNIHVWDGNELRIEGENVGEVHCDGITTKNDIYIDEKAVVDGTIYYGDDYYTLTLNYVDSKENNTNVYIYLEKNKTYSEKELYMKHFLSKDGYKLSYYTDSSLTTAWNMSGSEHTTVYGKWVEHNHTYSTKYIEYNNGIYEQCDCGFFGKSLTMEFPHNNIYNGKVIPIRVVNDLNISKDLYSIKYQRKVDGKWIDINGIPIEVGIYKAILTYNDMEIELEYDILEKVINPATGITIFSIIFVLFCSMILTLITYKKEKIK